VTARVARQRWSTLVSSAWTPRFFYYEVNPTLDTLPRWDSLSATGGVIERPSRRNTSALVNAGFLSLDSSIFLLRSVLINQRLVTEAARIVPAPVTPRGHASAAAAARPVLVLVPVTASWTDVDPLAVRLAENVDQPQMPRRGRPLPVRFLPSCVGTDQLRNQPGHRISILPTAISTPT